METNTVKPAVQPKTIKRMMSFIIGIAVLVFGVTFLTQFLNSRPVGGSGSRPMAELKELITVPFPDKPDGKEPIWDFNPNNPNQPADPPLSRDYEWGVRGQYAYWFENNSKDTVELGLERKGCSCQKVEVALAADPESMKKKSLKERVEAGEDASLHWVALRKEGDRPESGEFKDHVTIKPGEAGWFRASWAGSERQQNGPQYEKRSFSATLWTVANKTQGRPVKLQAFATYVDPIHVQSAEAEKEDRLDNAAKLGIVKIGQNCPVEFFCWSSTREFTLNLPQQANITVLKTYTLSANERDELEKRYHRHVKAAYRLTLGVKVPQLGPFSHKIVIANDVEPAAAGIVKGAVRDENVRILAEQGEPPDRIMLGKFSFHAGVEKTVRIEADKEVERLELLEHPVFLQVEPPKPAAMPDGPGTSWDLVVKVPPGKKDGPFGESSAEDCAIYLNILRKDKPPQRIRIPVSGEAIR